MSSVLAKVRAHGKRDEWHQVEVPEWGDTAGPLVIHHHPPTLGDIGKAAAVTAEVRGDAVRQNVELFVILARDAQGNPLFRRADVPELIETADPDVLGRVMLQMGIVRAPVKDAVAEKN